MASPFYKGLIARAVAGIPADVFRTCPALRSTGSRLMVFKPLIFAADGYPTAGTWKLIFPVSGCGAPTLLNFYFKATPQEVVNTEIGVPGTTLGDLVLQRDAVGYANAALAAHGCRGGAHVKNTRFEGFGIPNPPVADPGPGQRLRPWWETWTMVGCGQTFEFPMDFVRDERGTQVIQPGGVTER